VSKMDITDLLFAPLTRPVAVAPRPHHNGIVVRTVPFDATINVKRSIEVLRIEPAAHYHNSWSHVSQVLDQSPPLPEFIIIGMIQQLTPKEVVFALIGRSVFKTAQPKEEIIRILCLWPLHWIPCLLFRTVLLKAEHRDGEEIAVQ